MNEPVVIDRDALERLEEWGGRELIVKMLQIFLEHAPGRIDRIRSGSDRNALAEAERGAHSLKSSAGNVGARRLQRLAGELERRAAEGNAPEVRALLPRLEAAYVEARAALEAVAESLTD